MMKTIEQVHRMVATLDKIAPMLDEHNVMIQADILQNLLAAWINDHVDKNEQEDVIREHMRGVRVLVEEFAEQGQNEWK